MMLSGSFFVICYVGTCALGMLFAYFMFGTTFAEDILRKFHELGTNFKNTKNHAQIVANLKDVICFHVESRELSILTIYKKLFTLILYLTVDAN